MREAALPNFFIVGTGKAGTTSVYHYLKQHPQIYMSPVKEPCYFASEIRIENLTVTHLRHIRRMSRRLTHHLDDGKPVKPLGWLCSNWEDYLRLFQNVRGEKAIGEASAAYLWSETAAARIAACVPHANIVMILRDPAERAFSQYLHQLAVGLTYLGFREHIKKCMHNRERKIGTYYPLLEVGLYSPQVKRYIDLFPPERIRVYLYEEAWRNPASLLRDIYEFLHVDSGFVADTSRRSLERRAPRFATMNYVMKQFGFANELRRLVPACLGPVVQTALFRGGPALKMSSMDRRYLVDYYREDILKLSSLLNHDLSAWLSCEANC